MVIFFVVVLTNWKDKDEPSVSFFFPNDVRLPMTFVIKNVLGMH